MTERAGFATAGWSFLSWSDKNVALNFLREYRIEIPRKFFFSLDIRIWLTEHRPSLRKFADGNNQTPAPNQRQQGFRPGTPSYCLRGGHSPSPPIRWTGIICSVP